jgi:hypothetical protein
MRAMFDGGLDFAREFRGRREIFRFQGQAGDQRAYLREGFGRGFLVASDLQLRFDRRPAGDGGLGLFVFRQLGDAVAHQGFDGVLLFRLQAAGQGFLGFGFRKRSRFVFAGFADRRQDFGREPFLEGFCVRFFAGQDLGIEAGSLMTVTPFPPVLGPKAAPSVKPANCRFDYSSSSNFFVISNVSP